MPPRKVILSTNEIYHIFNRGHGGTPIFKHKNDYSYFIDACVYYQNVNPPCRFSKFKTLPSGQKNEILKKFETKKKLLVEILTFCLMPNHFHFLLKQKREMGITKFLRLVTNSYAKYFNTKYHKTGVLFESRFKAVRVENDKQLLHLSRYIHLNPYSTYLVKTIKKLPDYPFSSLKEYLKKEGNICNKELVLGQFSSLAKYKKFLFDYADYQRTLQNIKWQLLEEENKF